jgi:hypothetical protein
MRRNFIFLLLCVFPAAEPWQHRLDLEPVFRDPAALQKLKILYEPPSHEGYQTFLIYGDGSLVWRVHPKGPDWTGISTCKNKVSPQEVKKLVRLIIKEHFFDLPEKRFLFVYVSQQREDLELHGITIDDGVAKSRRVFGVGEYLGKMESLPSDFSAIEKEIVRLKDSNFPPSAKSCNLPTTIK